MTVSRKQFRDTVVLGRPPCSVYPLTCITPPPPNCALASCEQGTKTKRVETFVWEIASLSPSKKCGTIHAVDPGQPATAPGMIPTALYLATSRTAGEA